METKRSQGEYGSVVTELPVPREASPVSIMLDISRHLRESNSKQVEMIMETSQLRAAVLISNTRMAWMIVAILLLFGVVVAQAVRQEMSIRRLTMAERGLQQSAMKQQDIEVQFSKSVREVGKAREDLELNRQKLDELARLVPQLRVDGFGRVFLDVTIRNEAAADKLKKLRGRGKPLVSPDAKRASLPVSRGRIQCQ